MNHHQAAESIRLPYYRKATTEAPVTTLPKPPDFVELHSAPTTLSPTVALSVNTDRWTPKSKPYYDETIYKSNQASSMPDSSRKEDEEEEGDEEAHLAIGSAGGRGRPALLSSDLRFQYSPPPPPAPDEYSAHVYQNFTKDPIDWSALLLNYTKSNENFNATTFHELTHAYGGAPDATHPLRSPVVAAKPQKRRRYRPKVSTSTTTPSTTSTTTTTSTTRPPKIFLQPTLDVEDDDDDDPPRNIYGDAAGDGEASESSQATNTGTDQDEVKENDGDERYSSYPVISFPKSRTKGNYIGRPYNYHDLIATPSRSSADYQSIGSRNRDRAYNRFHRHHLHSAGSEEEDDSSAKYAAIRHYDPHRFASPSSMYPGYFDHPPLVTSDSGNGGEGTQL